jgi:hypothetical protein
MVEREAAIGHLLCKLDHSEHLGEKPPLFFIRHTLGLPPFDVTKEGAGIKLNVLPSVNQVCPFKLLGDCTKAHSLFPSSKIFNSFMPIKDYCAHYEGVMLAGDLCMLGFQFGTGHGCTEVNTKCRSPDKDFSCGFPFWA